MKDSLYWATPAERKMYGNAIKEGRGQKAVGLLIITGGSVLTTAGAALALASIVRYSNDDYGDDELFDENELIWKGGCTLFLAGLGTVMLGADKFKEGRRNVRSAKVTLKLNATSVGLVYNF